MIDKPYCNGCNNYKIGKLKKVPIKDYCRSEKNISNKPPSYINRYMDCNWFEELNDNKGGRAEKLLTWYDILTKQSAI